MNRVENVNRFVAALAQNPNHANETMKELVNMAEELADEVETRHGLTAQQNEEINFTLQKEEFIEVKEIQKGSLLFAIQTITFILCTIIFLCVIVYGFTNACRWVWNFYS